MLTNIAAYVPAYLSTYLPTNLPTYLSIYLPTKNLTYCPNSLHSWPCFSMCSNALTNINIYLPFYLHVKRLPNTPQILKINCSVYEYMNLQKKCSSAQSYCRTTSQFTIFMPLGVCI